MVAGLAGLLFAGYRFAFEAAPLVFAALAGSVIGTAIGLRWRSDRLIRYVLVAVLAMAGVELLIRSFQQCEHLARHVALSTVHRAHPLASVILTS